jgi:hypothetical protein
VIVAVRFLQVLLLGGLLPVCPAVVSMTFFVDFLVCALVDYPRKKERKKKKVLLLACFVWTIQQSA